MQLKPFLLDMWLDKYEHDIEFNLAASTGPVWTVNDILKLAGDAERERFPGSPTIRVDGRDVNPEPDQPIGLACRIYRLRDGRISPLPDRLDVRDTLVSAMEEVDR